MKYDVKVLDKESEKARNYIIEFRKFIIGNKHICMNKSSDQNIEIPTTGQTRQIEIDPAISAGIYCIFRNRGNSFINC